MTMQTLYGLLTALTFTLVTVPTVVLLAFVPGQERRRGIVKVAAALVFRLVGARPRVSGLANLPDEPCVAVANHASYIDGILLTAVLPPRFTFVIKREMTNVPFANFLLQRIGSAFVDRADPSKVAADARRILAHAGQQKSLAFFPEGTFRAEPGLRRFHNGAFAAARHGGLVVVPIVIRGSRHMLPAGRGLPRPSRLEVIIKPPIDPAAADLTSTELMQACRAKILADLGEPDATI